jgi:hypothetical protein
MVGELTDDMSVTPTNETKKIAGYTCRRYNVKIMGTTSQYWLSKEVTGYRDYQEYNKKMEKIVKKVPALKQMTLAGKLDGFPVQTIIDMMGVTSTTTLVRIEKTPLDKALFQVPKTYRLKELALPPRGMPQTNTPTK